MHWEQGCVFSYHEKIELKSLTQVSHVTKKIKNRWVKKAKKRKKEKVKKGKVVDVNTWKHRS